MDTFNIDVPVPSMGATVSELSVIVIKVQTGDVVTKGQLLADLESDKSAFEFESPCEGTIGEIMGKPGATMMSGDPFLQIETSDESMRHLDSNSAGGWFCCRGRFGCDLDSESKESCGRSRTRSREYH